MCFFAPKFKTSVEMVFQDISDSTLADFAKCQNIFLKQIIQFLTDYAIMGRFLMEKYTLLKIQVEQDRSKNLLSKWSCLYFLDASIFNQESGGFLMENKPEIRYFIIYVVILS